MSITSGRSLLRPDGEVELVLTRSVAFWRSFASGWTERSTESIDMLSAEVSPLELSLDRRRLLGFTMVEGFAHSGTG